MKEPHQPLNPDTQNFGTGIENVDDIENGHDDPHAIVGYLSDTRITMAIANAIP